MKRCCSATRTATSTSLGGMPKLRGNCPLSDSDSFQTTDVVPKHVHVSRCKEKVSPLSSIVLSLRNVPLFHQGSLEPLSFLRCLFFHRGSFLSSLVFLGVPLFSSEVSFLSPLVFLGVPLFSSDVFLEPLSVFRGASFFIGCLF
jgi:hypothetical protein